MPGGKMLKNKRYSFKFLSKVVVFPLFLIFLQVTGLFISNCYAENPKKADLVDRALEAIAMNKADLSMRSDISTNPYALSRFKRWMENPIKAPAEAQLKAMALFKSANNPVLWFQELAKLGDIDSAEPIPLRRYNDSKLPTRIPTQLSRAIHRVLDAIYTANNRLVQIKKEVSTENLERFKKYLYPNACRNLDPEKQMGELYWLKESKNAIDAAGSVNRVGILEAGLTVLEALTDARAFLAELDQGQKNVNSFSFMTDLGLVEIGGTGADVHESHATLIIDLGGNDIYNGKIASGSDGKSAVVIDLSGDDVYMGDKFTQGSGVWGVGILFDLDGNDFYKANDCSQGAGLFGIGMIIDGEGSDSYFGGEFVQAASAWGWGGLLDLAGEDTYQCQRSGQAYSNVAGVSSLCDLRGNDKYISGERTPDPRETGMNQSFSQGFAIGARNMAAGGFALLADKSGNDIYQCQYFGQGASYWMGVGVLYDEHGKDTYLARRYAQGAGIHFSFGLLMDVKGDDHTFSWGVSQGCGHDYGVGLLVNDAGNDTYVSNWLSMGASNANGVGIFIDNTGNDGYETHTGTAVGSLHKSRRSGGIGLFVDSAGEDRYSKNGANNSIWAPNRWGVGIDEDVSEDKGLKILPVEDTPPVNEEADKKKREEQTRLSAILDSAETLPFTEQMEPMLSVASHWGFEKEIPKAIQEKLLNLNPERSVPAVTALIDTPSIMTQIFMNRFFAVHAFEALPELTKKAQDPDSLIKSRALNYLGRLRDTRTLARCLEGLNKPSWRVRYSAVRALGEILEKNRLVALIPMKEALEKALKKNNPYALKDYFKDKEKIKQVLSVLARAVSIEYPTYLKYEKKATKTEKSDALNEYIELVYDRSKEILPLVERWIKDITQSEDIAIILTAFLEDPDSAVKRAAAYALGQMNYRPSIPQIADLLRDRNLWVRDSAVLSLALFENDVLPYLESAMKQETSQFKILALDVCSRINSEQSKALIEGYLEDPDQNVRRTAMDAFK
jgi:HEAT repeat protein